MQTLRDVMEKTVNSYTSNLRLIKPLSSVNKTILKGLEQQIVKQLKDNVIKELEGMYSDENIEVLLNRLDELTRPGRADQSPAWRPSGDVRRDAGPHLVALKREKLKVLEAQLTDLEAQNKLLATRVVKREQHVVRTKDKIVAIAEELEQVVKEETNMVRTRRSVK
ncbi:hypothetical protein DPMN_112902 [Dreissena polymorpha]|uniref:Uncharacterized protein n=2 Tax=Dreissena polymorpha TaxID=45954 RepID=A0A9D4KI06_DREPO|nr:hypothetical protein DPMN_112902 [Dreissena polymorpha]